MATDDGNDAQLTQSLSNIAKTFERDVYFEEDYKLRLEDAEAATSFKGKELERLRSIVDELTKDNAILKNHHDSGSDDLQKVNLIVKKHPLKSLAMPCGDFFDSLAPIFAEFIEEYDDDFRHTPKFQEIWVAFGRIQQTEDCVTRCGKMIRELALVNFDLRASYIAGTRGEEHDELVTINGTKPHPLAFLRAVPSRILSNMEAPLRNPMAGIEQLEQLTQGHDLVLREFMPVVGQPGTYYFPLHSSYVPPFLGMGIRSTGPSIELADSIMFMDHEHFEVWYTPGGSRLWVSKTAPRGRWSL